MFWACMLRKHTIILRETHNLGPLNKRGSVAITVCNLGRELTQEDVTHFYNVSVCKIMHTKISACSLAGNTLIIPKQFRKLKLSGES